MKTLFKVSLILILITSLSSDEVTLLNAIIPDFQVSEIAQIPAGKGRPSISVDGNGDFIVAWTDYRNGNEDIYAQRFSDDGATVGNNFKVNDDIGILMQRFPTISADDSGSFIIVWEDDRNGNMDIYAQRFSSDGTPQGSNFKVNADITSTLQGNPSISVDSSGNFIIAWQDERNGNEGIYAQRYLSDGTVLGNNFKVSDDQGMVPAISEDDSGNFCITWGDDRNSNWDIYAQRFSSDGIPLGSNFRVNDDQGSNDHNYPSISTSGIGNFIISWWDGRSGGGDIYAQRYSNNGIPLGINFKVNDDQGSSNQWSTEISANVSGNFIITWWDTRNDDRDIYAQRYSSDGKILGSNFLVTNTGDGLQRYPDVELWNKRIYNTWEDDRGGETGCAIWANVLDWNDLLGISDDAINQTPIAYILYQNYPNPFNPKTIINYKLPARSAGGPITNYVKLSIYNLLGQKVTTLVDRRQDAGTYKVEWDASDFSCGVYYYRLETGEFQDVKKMVLLR